MRYLESKIGEQKVWENRYSADEHGKHEYRFFDGKKIAYKSTSGLRNLIRYAISGRDVVSCGVRYEIYYFDGAWKRVAKTFDSLTDAKRVAVGLSCVFTGVLVVDVKQDAPLSEEITGEDEEITGENSS